MAGDRRTALDGLLDPRSVAVVGATERAGAAAFYVMKNLMQCGYSGRIIPVHPTAQTVFGYPVASSLGAIGFAPDAAVIALSSDKVPAALEEAGRAGCKAAVILASGFGEHGEEGRKKQAVIAEIARRHGMAVCGPNCLGIHNLATGAALYASGVSRNLKEGAVALVSHSGASAIALANSGRFGMSHIVSAGNGAVTDIGDYIRYFADDPRTRIVGLVIEAIRDPESVIAAMRVARAAGKPVIVLRAGRSKQGSRATTAHTGALAGDSVAFGAFLRRVGMIEVADMDAFIETVVLCLAFEGRPLNPGIAIACVSGGGAAHVADIASEVGLSIPDIAPQTALRIANLLPSYATPQNPLDATSAVFGDGELYRQVLLILAEDPAIGAIVVAQDAPLALDDDCIGEYLDIGKAVSLAAETSSVPIIVISNLAQGHHPSLAKAFGGVPGLRGTRSALAAIGAVMRGGEIGCELPMAGPAAVNDGSFKAQLVNLLAPHLPRQAMAASAEDAARAAAEIGFPVAMKIVSPQIAHKSEAGGVVLNVADTEAARIAFKAIMDNARDYAPEAELVGVEIQEMVQGGIEVVAGLVRHPPFGLGIVIGLGGVLVELLQQTAFDLLPVNRSRIEAMIDATPLGPMMAGFRGAPAVDRDALVVFLVQLSALACEHGACLDAVDLNPIIVLPEGKGIRILDVLIEGGE